MQLGMGGRAQAEIESLREQLAAALAVAAEVARIKAINADLEARNALLELQNEETGLTLSKAIVRRWAFCRWPGATNGSRKRHHASAR
jgi:hypothetical protein